MSIRTLTPLVFGFLLASCTSVNVQHEFDPQVDLASYSTFGVLPNPHPADDSLAFSILGYADVPMSVAVSVLERKGFAVSEVEAADFFVGVRTKVVLESQVSHPTGSSGNEVLAMSGWDPGAMMSKDLPKTGADYRIQGATTWDPSTRDIDEYRNLRIYLFVDVFDAASRKLIWQGWARSGSLSDFNTDSKRAKKIEAILETFPN